MATAPAPLTLAEAVCLALLVEEPRHGWALVRELAPGAPLGRVWSLSRPLTYRALDQLAGRGLVRARREEPGAGPNRQVLGVTAAGRRALDAWLAAPVAHLRDARTDLLVKLTLHDRLGRDPAALLAAQLATYAPLVERLRARAAEPDAGRVDRWRARTATATEELLRDEARALRRR